MSSSLMESTWVTFDINQHICALRAQDIREMVILGKTSHIPRAPKHIRGVTNLRHNVFPCVDLRVAMGMNGFRDDLNRLIETLWQRKQDHINWVEALEKAIRQNTEFSLTTDPHQCAFGKWYDTYEPDDPILRMQLHFFDLPHRRIHAVADKAIALLRAGKKEDALDLIEVTKRNDLKVMRDLFDETVPMFEKIAKEVLLVCEYEGRKLGLIADHVIAVRDIDDDQISDKSEFLISSDDNNLVIGTTKIDDQIVFLLDNEKTLALARI